MKIALIGGHGKVALLATPLLVEAGHTVSSVIRTAEHRGDVDQAGATPLLTDIEKLDQLEWSSLLEGFDAVVWAAGAGGDSPERTWAVDFEAAKRSMIAAVKNGLERYIMVSYVGSSLEHEIDPDQGFWHYAQAKAEADTFLRGTDLDYTILGPSRLTFDEPTGQVTRLSSTPADGDSSGSLEPTSRGNVARMIVAALEAGESASRVTVDFTDGSTPISSVFDA